MYLMVPNADFEINDYLEHTQMKSVSNEKTISAFCGKIVLCYSEVRTTPGAKVKVFAESGWSPLLRPQFVLKVDSLNNAQVVDYKTLMLPFDDVQANHLQSIKQFVKAFFQHQVNKALSLFTYADDDPRKPSSIRQTMQEKLP